MAVQLRLSTDEAVMSLFMDGIGKTYSWEEGRCCGSLVREYLRLRTGHVCVRHAAEDEREMTAMRRIVKGGGLLPLYSGWLDRIPVVTRDEPESMTIGDIALVGAADAPPLISSFGTEYLCGRHKVLMGIVDGGGNLLHWTERGLATLINDWIPWVRVVYRPIVKGE